MAVAQTPDQKMTALRIQRALARPGAIGMKGFLLWTEAAWPRPIAKKVLEAAAQYTPGAGASPSARIPALASPASGGFGFFGDTSTYLYGSLPADDASTDPTTYTDPTTVTPSATTSATPAQPASNSWLSDVADAFKTASLAYLGTQQIKDAQSIFNINLQRAQQGLPPIPTNPTQYGLPAPTAQVGLTSSTQTAMLWGVALLAGGLVLSGRGRR